MKRQLSLPLAVLLSAAPICGRAESVKIETVPAPVQKTIQAQVGDGKMGSLDKINEGGEVIYDVGMTKDGKTRDFSVGENGALLSLEISLSELPLPVQKTIQAQVGKGKLGDIYKSVDEGEVSYDVEMTQDGKTRSFTVDDKGTIIEEQMFLNELPAPVRKAIHKETAGATLGDITKSTEEGETVYEVDISKTNVTRTVTFNVDGVLLSEEQPVTLADAPEAAQKKIKSLAGEGKIGGIFKVTEDGDISYDVDILQGGTRKSVTVGSDGELLDDEK